jgi:hypothetical protein
MVWVGCDVSFFLEIDQFLLCIGESYSSRSQISQIAQIFARRKRMEKVLLTDFTDCTDRLDLHYASEIFIYRTQMTRIERIEADFLHYAS